ncbi:MAG: ZIP family metal transporter [Pyrinomonadaceae bacterium]
MSLFLQVLLFGVLASSANVLGGLILFPSKLHSNYRNALRYVLALGAGFMLSVTLLEIFPESLKLWLNGAGSVEVLYKPMLLVVAGYLLTQFFEHTIAPHFHLGEEMHCEDEEHEHATLSTGVVYTAVAGLFVHAFFDGISIAAAAEVNAQVGLLVFLAIFLHKFPEGFTIGSMVLAAGKKWTSALATTALVGSATLLGVLVIYFAGDVFGFTVAYALPLAGGVALYVSASDLIPEVNHHGPRKALVSVSVFAGVALFFLTQQLLHSVLE